MNLLFVPDFVPDGLTGTGGVPVLPVDNRTRKAGSVGTRSAPAENHVLLLKDEPSCCHRDGKVWKLKEVEFRSNRCMTVASRGPREGRHGEASEEIMAFDAATRIWRGRESLGIRDLIVEGAWPTNGTKSLDGQAVLLGIT